MKKNMCNIILWARFFNFRFLPCFANQNLWSERYSLNKNMLKDRFDILCMKFVVLSQKISEFEILLLIFSTVGEQEEHNISGQMASTLVFKWKTFDIPPRWAWAPPRTDVRWLSRPGWRHAPCWCWASAWPGTGGSLSCLWSAGCRCSCCSWSPVHTHNTKIVLLTCTNTVLLSM